MNPTLKKTISGYVIKHTCRCGEGLINKISEVDSQDLCPACKSAFIVPGRNLVMQLKEKLAAKKKQAEQAKQQAREQREEQRAAKAEANAEHPATPVIRLPKIGTSNVNESQLRSLADTAGEWIGLIGNLFLAAAILCQFLLIAFGIWTFVETSQRVGMTLELARTQIGIMLFGSLVIWASYYLLRVQLGMVAAVILIERNTRDR